MSPTSTPQATCAKPPKSALDEGYTHYTARPVSPSCEGHRRLRGQERGLKFDPENVVVTPGAKPIMFYTMMALIEPGDEVIYPNPGFPIYESMINFLGGVAVPLQLSEQRDFRINLDELESKISVQDPPDHPQFAS